MMLNHDQFEWLEADGMGGFASGTATGVRTRRYHALLLAATTPPTGRMVLVNGFDAWITTPTSRTPLSTQRYQPDVLHPDGFRYIKSFRADPWPVWEFETPEGVRLSQEIVVEHGGGGTALVWRLLSAPVPVTLEVRPFLSGRDYHSLHHENGAFAFSPASASSLLIWRPYAGLPDICASTNGGYMHAPEWYRNFLYTAERERGLDDTEDLASPGVLAWTLDADHDTAVVVLSTTAPDRNVDAVQRAREIQRAEATRRAQFSTPIDRAADAYLVQRGTGRSIVAGYPWFTDWGRDTFIALRGLCIATGRLAEARDILVEWSSEVSEGMLPNRFPDAGEAPEFNAVDASLWFVIAVHDLVSQTGDDVSIVSHADRAKLREAVLAIVEGYARGTRYGIREDNDALLSAGERGLQLTWMDARVGDRVITPRIGKPVEVEALWLNALWVASSIDPRWESMLERGRCSFTERFWNREQGCLHDVVDVDHVAGTHDPTIRPNQILAVGGLPLQLLENDKARRVVDRVERELLTPFGLRSLAPTEAGYRPIYEGGPSERDAIYHQGVVWPWLLGAFVDAWVRVRGGTAAARRAARARFVDPLVRRMTDGSGHLCEITDAIDPFRARGCPFQAWSLGEILRLDRVVLAQRARRRGNPARARAAANVATYES